MTIEMKPVTSSQITSIGYAADTETLAILFKGGTSPYHYTGVPASVYADLMAAESVGSFFHNNIKPFKDKYPFVKQPVPEKKEGG